MPLTEKELKQIHVESETIYPYPDDKSDTENFRLQEIKRRVFFAAVKAERELAKEEKDNFAIQFAIWCLYDPQAKAYIESKVTAYKLLELYKDRPYINPDTNLQ